MLGAAAAPCGTRRASRRTACRCRAARGDRRRRAALPRPMFTTCAPSASRDIVARFRRPASSRRVDGSTLTQQVESVEKAREAPRRPRSSVRRRSLRAFAHGRARRSPAPPARARSAPPMTPSPMTPGRRPAPDARGGCCSHARRVLLPPVRVEPLREAHRRRSATYRTICARHAGVLDADQRHVARKIRHAQHVPRRPRSP